MLVKSGRGGGHTTQLFFEILASDKDIIVWCRNPKMLVGRFFELFHTFVKEIYQDKMILIDNREIRFITSGDSYEKVRGFKGEIKADE